MKKVIIFTVLFLVAVSAFSETILKFAYSREPASPRGIASELFKSTVEMKSKNKIKIELYDSSKLGVDAQVIEGVVNGSVDMTVASADYFATYAPKVGISRLPYLFSDLDKARKFMDSEIVAEINKDLERSNIVVLAHFDNGFRCVTTAHKPVYSVRDMKDLRIRTSVSQANIETIAALGALPVSLVLTEVPEVLKKGLLDGQENSIQIIYNNKLYNYQKYLAMTNHSYEALPFVIRKDLWDSLSKSYQKIIKDAALQAQKINRDIIKEQNENLVKNLKNEGMIITNPDIEEFAEATKGVYDIYAKFCGQELIEQVKTFAGKK